MCADSRQQVGHCVLHQGSVSNMNSPAVRITWSHMFEFIATDGTEIKHNIKISLEIENEE